MTYAEFIKAHVGKGMDFDGVAGVQCVDLAKYFLKEVFGITAGAWGDAHAYYNNFDNLPLLKANFVRIPNTPSFVPQKGDIVVWSASLNGGWGHIAIATGEGNTSWFSSYDQNWTGHHDACAKTQHNYDHVLGVLRAKDQSKITGVKPLPVLDKRGCKLGDKNTGVLAIKCLLLIAYKLGMTSKVAKDAGFGAGTRNSVNTLLKKWGYKQTGIAGVNFIKRLHSEINAKIK